MSKNSPYAREKLYNAIFGMATSPKPLQDRVADAFIFHIHHLTPSRDLSPEFRPLFDEISSSLTTEEARGDEGNVRATTNKMSDDDAIAMAQKIVRLADEVIAS